MSTKKITIAYWASTDLYFIKATEDYCNKNKIEFVFIKIDHHPSWFTSKRSIVRNAIHLICIFSKIIYSSINSNICIFGLNACRFIFPFSMFFSRVTYVYNELPELRKSRCLFWYDRFIFNISSLVYVSSKARRDLILTTFKIDKKIGILKNISFDRNFRIKPLCRNNKIIFTGSVTSKRFDENDFNKIKYLSKNIGSNITVYGFLAQEISNEYASVMDYKGNVSHNEMLCKLKDYNFGLLSYYMGDENNDFCAPIKIYEYVASGCTIISINKNKGLLEVSKKFPDLIYFSADFDFSKYKPNYNLIEEQRLAFLSDAFSSNEDFVRTILSVQN